LLAVTQRKPKNFEVVIGQISKYAIFNMVISEGLGILAQSAFAEPLCQILTCSRHLQKVLQPPQFTSMSDGQSKKLTVPSLYPDPGRAFINHSTRIRVFAKPIWSRPAAEQYTKLLKFLFISPHRGNWRRNDFTSSLRQLLPALSWKHFRAWQRMSTYPSTSLAPAR
ncbi:MAG: hypothetical protein WB774_15345, partial [Xanthobacteraceae bacterium]